MDRSTRKELDFEVGSRGKKPLKSLLERLSRRFNIKKYFSDDYPVYKSVIDKDRLFVGKSGTWQVESANSRVRHFLARFKRRGRCYSKCLEMVKLSLYLLFEEDLLPT